MAVSTGAHAAHTPANNALDLAAGPQAGGRLGSRTACDENAKSARAAAKGLRPRTHGVTWSSVTTGEATKKEML